MPEPPDGSGAGLSPQAAAVLAGLVDARRPLSLRVIRSLSGLSREGLAAALVELQGRGFVTVSRGLRGALWEAATPP